MPFYLAKQSECTVLIFLKYLCQIASSSKYFYTLRNKEGIIKKQSRHRRKLSIPTEVSQPPKLLQIPTRPQPRNYLILRNNTLSSLIVEIIITQFIYLCFHSYVELHCFILTALYPSCNNSKH